MGIRIRMRMRIGMRIGRRMRDEDENKDWVW